MDNELVQHGVMTGAQTIAEKITIAFSVRVIKELQANENVAVPKLEEENPIRKTANGSV